MSTSRPFPLNELDRLHPNGFVTLGKAKSTTYSEPFYVVATEKEGLYFYVRHQQSVELLVYYHWNQIPDELFKSDRKNDRTYRHKKNVVLTIFVGDEEGKEVAKLIEQRKKISLLARPWYRKILGYRSGTGWKMLIASLVYFSLLTGLVNGDDEKDKAEPVKTEQINTLKAEDQSDDTKDDDTDDDDKAKKEAAEKAKAEKERERKAELAAQKKAEEEEAAKKAEEKKAAELAAQKEAEKKAEEERIAQEEEAAAAEAVETDFANCTDLRTVYPDGVPSTHPAYQDKMDRDNDAFACEQN
ncbi:excalibur calcium-binding domain-containing protein [Exiguobacterium antarcticum]|uniref:excalibur calcium-binding domain-containing protein n=1 Tax=Exiguobacterium antarcticum TaxID=132920 RepID=UPI00068E4387|nr:excalibur calcium-binding domain-containing protein [Exiguobacterium antarcticum]